MIAGAILSVLLQAAQPPALREGDILFERNRYEEAVAVWRAADAISPAAAYKRRIANALRIDAIWDHGAAERLADPARRDAGMKAARTQMIEAVEAALAAERAAGTTWEAQAARMELFLCFRSLGPTQAFALRELDLERHLKPSTDALEAYLALNPRVGDLAQWGQPELGLALLTRDPQRAIPLIERLADLTPGQPETAIALAKAAADGEDTRLARKAVAALRAAGTHPRADAVLRRRMQDLRISLGSR